MAHPEIFAEILSLPLDNSEYARDSAGALGCKTRVHIWPVVSIRDVDPFVARYGMRDDGNC